MRQDCVSGFAARPMVVSLSAYGIRAHQSAYSSHVVGKNVAPCRVGVDPSCHHGDILECLGNPGADARDQRGRHCPCVSVSYLIAVIPVAELGTPTAGYPRNGMGAQILPAMACDHGAL